jgi:hypothetical protein
VSIRNCSSGTLANSGTAFKTAVETGVAIAEINLPSYPNMVAEARNM